MNYQGSNKFIRVSLLAVLAFCTLFFGGVHTWVYSFAQIYLLCLLALFILVRVPGWWQSGGGEVRWIVTPVNWVALLFLCLILLQLVPLPRSVVALLSPNNAQVLEMSGGVTKGSVETYHFSLYRGATIQGLLTLVDCLYFYFLIIYTIRRRSHLQAFVRTMLWIGVLIGVYGLFERLSHHDHILWWRHQWSAEEGFRVFGTFINPDHFAFYVNIMLYLFVGSLFCLIISKSGGRRHRSQSIFRRMIENEADIPRAVFLLFCCVLMVLILLMTGSRGAILALALSMFGVLFLFFGKTKRKSLFVIMVILLGVVLIYGQRMGIERVFDRFGQISKSDFHDKGRMLHNRSAFPLVGVYPVFGSGLGTFQHVYERYQPDQDKRYRDCLHNDWLQLTIETGVVGFLIVFLGFVFLIVKYIRLWQKRNDPYAVGMGIGCIGAILASGLHSFLDFSLHVPANALALTAVIAIGFLALNSRGGRTRQPFIYRVRRISMWGRETKKEMGKRKEKIGKNRGQMTEGSGE